MTFSRMTLGEPTLKAAMPPRGEEPCENPYISGANILLDPNLDLAGAHALTSPLGDEMLMESAPYWYYWYDLDGLGDWYSTDGSASIGPPIVDTRSPKANADTSYIANWYGTPNVITDDKYRIRIVSTSPHSGTYHIRQSMDYLLWNHGAGFYIVDARNVCNPGYYDSGWQGLADGYTARVNGGDYIKFSFWSKVSSTSSPYGYWGPASISAGVSFYDVSGTYLGDIGYGLDYPTTSYSQFSVDGFAPAGSYFCWTYIGIAENDFWGLGDATQPGLVHFDYDTFSFEVTP